jgi:hypothetical protein
MLTELTRSELRAESVLPLIAAAAGLTKLAATAAKLAEDKNVRRLMVLSSDVLSDIK